ncbi:hypothetical protein DPMN_065077 [Dreissena polymorpha]|uniref:Uncharacterized protein n=1 Tax=Dreissena polymorpha TaxID=45954 RepID=A0A9D4CEC4_DREPO|nr:hypothetical protein DPMN_065077 [Dreissena polymorpha]
MKTTKDLPQAKRELCLMDLFERLEIQNSFPAVGYLCTLSQLIPSSTAVERLSA